MQRFINYTEMLDYLEMRCLLPSADGFSNQSLPIVLAVSTADKERLDGAKAIALHHNGRPVAILRSPEFFPHNKEERCSRQFGICNRGHPYVDMIFNAGDWLVGGDLEVLDRVRWNDGLDDYRLTPRELRSKFREMEVSWKIFDGLEMFNSALFGALKPL